MLYLVLFFLTKSQNINETPIKISLKYFGLFKFEKIAVRENQYVRKLQTFLTVAQKLIHTK